MDFDKTSINEPNIDLEFKDMCIEVTYSSPRVILRFFKGS